MRKKEFDDIIDNITIDVLETDESKTKHNWTWAIDGEFINRETYGGSKLTKLLYRIGFIGIKSTSSSEVKYLHNNNEVPLITDEAKFYINPCYHSAIQVKFHSQRDTTI